ncbi:MULTISPECIES: hydroxypyruvate isomerase [Vibrio]|uniref:Hydroxypyruvate isomerase n=1 Tax=Vibrio mediterranei TaxID=689 RepID=A0ABX5DCY2_9VIBR|nr:MULTISPECIES: hydroxypyruvate isomerase [Vibrio]MCF4175379.1 hydroxypyruvate isomerase [Vibrio sp. McD22-P3]PCD85678.1 hydroxypyruvate isomerase [Vibrio mediterranei]PRQ66908.1 hydroxypyruvate isomerase [Vibrio mediterranei]SBO09877.1 Hydroxypyruvate isomerase [Vibrio mediterranei]
MPKLAANLSMLFTEYKFIDRFEAASRSGFQGVEYLFPYDFEPKEIADKLNEYSLTQVLFNLPAGDWDKGERGIACHPERIEEFREGVSQAIRYAKVLNCNQLNCLVGIKPENVTEEDAFKTTVNNLKYASEKLGAEGIQLIVEAINTQDMPNFFINSTQKAIRIISEVGKDNLQYQYDIYHMQIMEGNLARTLTDHKAVIKHIQLADNPGRNEPGTGEINYPFLLKHIDEIGYEGWIGCEYVPKTTTEESLSWIKEYNLV